MGAKSSNAGSYKWNLLRAELHRYFLFAWLALILAVNLRAEDAIPAALVGTWKRTEVINKRTGQGANAGRKYFMIMRADGHVQWFGSKGAPDYPPMKMVIRNGTDIYQVTSSGEKAIGKAILDGDKLKLLFAPVQVMVDSGYVRVSRSVDPKDVAGVKP